LIDGRGAGGKGNSIYGLQFAMKQFSNEQDFVYWPRYRFLTMRLKLFLLLSALLIISCKKEKDVSSDYYYFDFVPDTVFPMPATDDVTNRFLLQFGTDTVAGIEIFLRTASTYSAHMPVTDYWIWLSGQDTSLRFIEPEGYPYFGCSPPLDSGTIITISDLTIGDYLLYMHNWNWPNGQYGCSTLEQGGYIGFRFARGGQYYMGWMWARVTPDLSFLVTEYCYSLDPGAPIQTGMKK
jgi:hypothetical protein